MAWELRRIECARKENCNWLTLQRGEFNSNGER